MFFFLPGHQTLRAEDHKQDHTVVSIHSQAGTYIPATCTPLTVLYVRHGRVKWEDCKGWKVCGLEK